MSNIVTNRTFIAASPPTPNGDLHLGHLAGPYLGADVLSRALRLEGADVDFVTGSDDHQSYVVLEALRRREVPEKTVSWYADILEDTLERAAIEPTVFVRTEESTHHQQLVREAVDRLIRTGAAHAVERRLPFCLTTNQYLFEAFVSGACAKCGADADANVCEVCAFPVSAEDFDLLHCAFCDETPEWRSVRVLVLSLERVRTPLTTYVQSVAMPARMRSVGQGVLSGKLPDVFLTYPSSWGISVDVSGVGPQRVNPWVEMIVGYLTGAADARHVRGSLAEAISTWNEYDEIVECFGFDNTFFHLFVGPAVLWGLDEEVRVPDTFVLNQFLRLDGSKFSTSRKHAIWARDFLDAEPRSVVRAYLSKCRPAVERTNFTLEDYERYKTDLTTNWEGWIRGLDQALRIEHADSVPNGQPTGDEQLAFVKRVEALLQYAWSNLQPEVFDPAGSLAALDEVVRMALRLESGHLHLRAAEDADGLLAGSRVAQLSALFAFGNVVSPLLPDLGDKIREIAEIASVVVDAANPTSLQFPSAGTKVVLNGITVEACA